MKKITFVVLGIIVPFYCACAANTTFSFRVPESSSVGSPIKITLLLDTQSESINAVSGSIDVTGPVKIRRVRTDASIIPLWVSKPVYSSTTITYEGIIPGGFDGVYNVSNQALGPGTLLSFDVIAWDVQPITITSRGTVYQNDGEGVGVSVPDYSVVINPVHTEDVEINDNVYALILNSIAACGIILLLWFLRNSFKKRYL